MRSLTPLILMSALLGFALTACSPQPDPPSDGSPTTSSGSTTGEETHSTTPEKPEEAPPAEPLPDMPKDGDDVAILDTDKGQIVVMFYPEVAPKHVENFKSLVKEGFYNGTRFHRCMPGFMIQGGDPNSKDLSKAEIWGTGGKMVDGAERNVPLEAGERLKHTRGVLSMARGQALNSASSQFFLMHQDSPSLDGQYSAFGKIVKGIEVVDEIVKTGPTDPSLNGAVPKDKAVVLKKATLAKWPVK
ncbi:MAG: peptidylprolyl isomerase [Fimbriimonadaceae bacterium]|nr:MAG: peptidylprolyl isomerase [Fimbriimonadaceae bacterium]